MGLRGPETLKMRRTSFPTAGSWLFRHKYAGVCIEIWVMWTPCWFQSAHGTACDKMHTKAASLANHHHKFSPMLPPFGASFLPVSPSHKTALFQTHHHNSKMTTAGRKKCSINKTKTSFTLSPRPCPIKEMHFLKQWPKVTLTGGQKGNMRTLTVCSCSFFLNSYFIVYS
jgi:hypothetical protein